jgi:hypothetical protein
MRSDDALHISLGFSAQTRRIIDQLGATATAMPFDHQIITRRALVEAIRGQKPGKTGKLNNPHKVELWTQFGKLARSDARKNFVLSNAGHDLQRHVGGNADFDRDFGLGRNTFCELVQALDTFGARNYTMTFLSRSLCEIEDTVALRDPRLDHRFVGILSRRPDIAVAAGLFGALAEPSLSAACGAYDHARTLVKAINPDVAIIYDMSAGQALPRGSLTRLNGGFAAFFEGRGQCLRAVSAEHGLYFSNGARWSRDVVGQALSAGNGANR